MQLISSQESRFRAARSRGKSEPERIWAWIEKHCRIPDGIFMGKPFKLHPWQKEIIKGIYGSPTRRAIISFGRKNGKTSLAAVLLLVHLCGPKARRNSELYSTALSRDQAAILFRLAAKIVRLSPTLRDLVLIRDTIKQLYCPGIQTLFTALSSEASTNFGLSPAFVCHDELGQVRGQTSHALYEAIETATGAQEAPLSIVISTQSPNDSDLLSVLIDDAQADNDPLTKLFMFSAPEDADPFIEETIKLANPAFDYFQNKKEVLDMAEAARRMPAREAEYRNLILNQRVEAQNPFITKSDWDRNGASPGELGEIFGGLDLSSTADLTAFVMVSPNSEMFDVVPVFWLPGDGLRERSLHDRVPYDLWHEKGFLKTTPGRSVQYEFVAKYLANIIATKNVRQIAFDKYNMKHLRPWLIKTGMTEGMIDEKFKEFNQGWFSMSPALRTLEENLLQARMRHGSHPVLNMCAANAVVRIVDEASNRKLDKKRSRGRIDGMVALAMATSLAVAKSAEKHVYQVPIDRIVEKV